MNNMMNPLHFRSGESAASPNCEFPSGKRHSCRFIRAAFVVLTLGEAALLPLHAAIPEVSNVTMTQAQNRRVTITYQLTGAPAVVTLDIQTNANTSATANDPGWTSIGGAAICNAQGDVWKQVSGKATYTITWQPDQTWKDPAENGFKIAANGARARVTAWPIDNTPDYMVVDVSAAAQPNTQKYYPAADFVPGGILGKSDYRTTSLVMRKIMAKDVEWTMGSTTLETKRNATREATHQVTLTNNYYIGVFPVTQAQWDQIQPSRLAPSYFNNAADRAMRPVEQVCYNEIRNAANSTTADTAYDWPHDPNPGSFLGLLRTKTGLDFDLPSEAQWEFAARAGNGDTKWGDGSGILNTDKDGNLDMLGRYERNGGKVLSGSSYAIPAQSCGAANGTAIVGSYAPNAWGIYDMHGNMWEWCLDWYEDNINAPGGKVNIDPAAPANTLSGASGANRVLRGGSWSDAAGYCRPAFRNRIMPTYRGNSCGFRVACQAGLQ